MTRDERAIKTEDFERWLAALMAHTPHRRSSRGPGEHAEALDRMLDAMDAGTSAPEVIVHGASDSQVIARISPG